MQSINTKHSNSHHRVLLLTTTRSYRASDFLTAAEKLNIEIVQGVDMPQELKTQWSEGLTLDFAKKDEAIQEIITFAQVHPINAILSVDDSGSVLAAMASKALGLTHNSIEAAEATRDKYRMRQLLAKAPVLSPDCKLFTSADDPSQIAQLTTYPCVVKPLQLNGSRGVIRADDEPELLQAIERVNKLLDSLHATDKPHQFIVERYIPGIEVALEGLLDNGRLQILALYDKPDLLEGPFFEETIYVTPSRLPHQTQEAIKSSIVNAAKALGLAHGPIHAELRINKMGPWIVEVAGRSIGGLCARTLQFGMDTSLEELILRQAIRQKIDSFERIQDARGVMMIPIPDSGLLREVNGIEEAERIGLIEKVEITAHLNYPLVPLPEGDGYLGFIFAKGETPEQVESALRQAHELLTFRIDALLPIIS